MPPNAPGLVADVKVENMVVTAGWTGVELCSAGRNAYKQLQIAIRSPCMLYDVPFKRLLEAVEQSDKYISKGLHAVICDTPCIPRRDVRLSNSEHYRLILQDMSSFLELLSTLMDRACAHGHALLRTAVIDMV